MALPSILESIYTGGASPSDPSKLKLLRQSRREAYFGALLLALKDGNPRSNPRSVTLTVEALLVLGLHGIFNQSSPKDSLTLTLTLTLALTLHRIFNQSSPKERALGVACTLTLTLTFS